MNLNSVLESISKEQTKPRLKERPLSESEVINSYSTIASERYAILTEYSNIRINAMRSYSESDESDEDFLSGKGQKEQVLLLRSRGETINEIVKKVGLEETAVKLIIEMNK